MISFVNFEKQKKDDLFDYNYDCENELILSTEAITIARCVVGLNADYINSINNNLNGSIGKESVTDTIKLSVKKIVEGIKIIIGKIVSWAKAFGSFVKKTFLSMLSFFRKFFNVLIKKKAAKIEIILSPDQYSIESTDINKISDSEFKSVTSVFKTYLNNNRGQPYVDDTTMTAVINTGNLFKKFQKNFIAFDILSKFRKVLYSAKDINIPKDVADSFENDAFSSTNKNSLSNEISMLDRLTNVWYKGSLNKDDNAKTKFVFKSREELPILTSIEDIKAMLILLKNGSYEKFYNEISDEIKDITEFTESLEKFNECFKILNTAEMSTEKASIINRASSLVLESVYITQRYSIGAMNIVKKVGQFVETVNGCIVAA